MQLRRMAVRSRERQHLAVHSVNGPMLGIAKSGCVLNQRIQHRLQVKSRAAYDFQYFAGRRLLVQRFGEIADFSGPAQLQGRVEISPLQPARRRLEPADRRANPIGDDHAQDDAGKRDEADRHHDMTAERRGRRERFVLANLRDDAPSSDLRDRAEAADDLDATGTAAQQSADAAPGQGLVVDHDRADGRRRRHALPSTGRADV